MSGSAQVIKNLYAWANMKKAGLEGLAKTSAAGMQTYARQNRPWKDQTGNARAGLNGGSFWQNPFCILIYLAHSMEYGPYLELANSSKNEILRPTVEKFAPEIHKNAKRIMEQ